MPQPLAGLSRLADDTDVFLLDLWGVVHGGVAPFPGVIATLEALRTAGKKVVFVTNAPVRAHHVAEQLVRMGLGPLHDALLTSGEATYDHLRRAHDGGRYVGLGPSWAKLLHDDLPLTRTHDLHDADLLLVVGLEDERRDPAAYDADLALALARGLPLVCANPDRIIVVQDGTYHWCAGALADRYAAMGGEVVWLGKPDPAIFEAAAAAVGVDDPARCVVVGDGLPTDIKGANAFGARSVLVTRGIHARDLGIAPGEAVAPAAVAALADAYDARPDYILATLAW